MKNARSSGLAGKRRWVTSAVNIASLSSIQISNAIVPLIIYPYVLWMVKSEGFSAIVVAEALNLFLLSLVLYSFEVDGVAAVVRRRADAEGAPSMATIFWEMIVARILLYGTGLLILLSVGLVFWPQLNWLVLGWSLVSLAYAIQPNWFFQGQERNVPLAACVLTSRLAALAAIVFAISGPDDYAKVPFIVGFSYFLGGLAALIYACVKYRLPFTLPSSERLSALFWGGKEIFVGNFATGLYRDSNVLLLAFLGVPSAGIAAYSLADKAVKVFQAAMRPFNQFFFPSALGVAHREQRPSVTALKEILRLTWPQQIIAASLIACGITGYFVLAYVLPDVGASETIGRAFFLALVMVLSVFPGIAVYMLGIAGLNTLGARKYLLAALATVGLLNVLGNLLLVPLLHEMGSAICFLIAEFLLVVLIIRRYLVDDSRTGN